MPINTASPSENRLRLLGIKTVYGDSDPTTAIGSNMGIPTLYINNSSKDAFLLTETDPVTWVDVGEVSFGPNVLSILDASAAPPSSPTTGQAYLLDSTTTINAGWVTAGATYDDRVEWSGSSWLVKTPSQGDIVYVDDVSDFYIYDGSDWILLSGSISGLTYIVETRPPNTSDTGYQVPTLWIDSVGKTSFILTDETGGISTWLKMADNQLGDAQNSVLSIADSTATPPTEVLGDRYILSTDGAPNAAWDGAAQEDIVQFDGATWVALTPSEGTFCEVEDVDTVYIFITSWVKMFTYTGATFASDSGNANPTAAGIITFAGTTAQGLDSSATGSTVTYTILDASTSQKGTLETATDAEAIAVTATDKALVPGNVGPLLAEPPAIGGTTAAAGSFTTLEATLNQYSVLVGGGTTAALTELTVGTNGQVLVGSSGADPVFATVASSDGSITYAVGAGTLGATVTQAGEAQLGGAQLATQAEVTTGTDDTTIITPLKHVTSLASPPSIGGTAPAAGAFTTLSASTAITVPSGGSGRDSHTAYAVICGGTTTTAAQQSIASVGTSGQILTSNGAGALPTFQAAAAAPTDFDDSTFRIQDNGDATKEIAFEASSITTSTVRTITMVDADITLLNPAAVAITGGNIDGTTVGGTTAAAVTGTTITANTKYATDGDNDCDIGDSTNAFKDIYMQGNLYFDNDNSRTQNNYCWVPIASATASTSATLEFTLSSSYDIFLFILESVLPEDDGESLRAVLSPNGGSSYHTNYGKAGYYASNNTGTVTSSHSTTQTGMDLGRGQGNDDVQHGMCGTFMLFNANDSAKNARGRALTQIISITANDFMDCSQSTFDKTTAAVNYVKFVYTGGNIASGQIVQYGRKFI